MRLESRHPRSQKRRTPGPGPPASALPVERERRRGGGWSGRSLTAVLLFGGWGLFRLAVVHHVLVEPRDPARPHVEHRLAATLTMVFVRIHVERCVLSDRF